MTIPDPQLTKEFGLPNACNRCHQDKDVDWSIQWVDKWYGPRMNRPTRERARVLASLKKEDHSVVPKAIEMLKNEKNGAWRAVYLKMLAPVLASRGSAGLRDAVQQVMIDRLADGSPLVQATAVDALEPMAATLADKIRPLLQAPFRIARVRAAWALRDEIDLRSPVGQELSTMLRGGLDQPTGAFRWANYLNGQNRPQEALAWYAKRWTGIPHSAPFPPRVRGGPVQAGSARPGPHADAGRLAPGPQRPALLAHPSACFMARWAGTTKPATPSSAPPPSPPGNRASGTTSGWLKATWATPTPPCPICSSRATGPGHRRLTLRAGHHLSRPQSARPGQGRPAAGAAHRPQSPGCPPIGQSALKKL